MEFFFNVFLVLCITIMIFPGLIISPIDYKEINESEWSSRQKNIISTVNSYQQRKFERDKSFTNDFDSVFRHKTSYPGKIYTYYNYFIETQDNIAYVYSIPKNQYDSRRFLKINFGENKKKPFFSYIGASLVLSVGRKKNLNIKSRSIICKNNAIGIAKPKKPIFKNDSLFCGEGTREIREHPTF